MDVLQTVETALEDQPVEGAACLEAGAGAGNTTAGLLAAGASRVYAITNDRDHATGLRGRLSADDRRRAMVIEADLREIPLPRASVDLITAHGLFNVVAPADVDAVAAELTRVATPGCRLVVDDYETLPADAAIRDLFSLENATMELVAGHPALTFYPADLFRRLFDGWGWTVDRERTLLDPVPWTENHVQAHADIVHDVARELPNSTAELLREQASQLVDEIGSESAGEMYSLAFRR